MVVTNPLNSLLIHFTSLCAGTRFASWRRRVRLVLVTCDSFCYCVLYAHTTVWGQYLPVPVEHLDDGKSYFMLQQGVQRRVVVTIAHESGADLAWGKVMDMTIGEFCCLFCWVFLIKK